MLSDTPPTGEAGACRSIHARIHREMEWSVARTTAAGVDAIDARLRELDREWDAEQVLQAVAASTGLAGLALGLSRGRWWFALPALASACLLQQAVRRTCLPLALIRARGVRTASEIDQERYALKAARGDFARIGHAAASPRAMLSAALR